MIGGRGYRCAEYVRQLVVSEECGTLLSSGGDILSMVGNRFGGLWPVDKAFSKFSRAFLLEKLDEN
jgi:hypothetical protein